MKRKYIAVCLTAAMVLTGCGVDITPPDEFIKPPAQASTEVKDELALANCTYEMPSGEIGQFKLVTPNGVSKTFREPQTVIATEDVALQIAVEEYPEQYRGQNFSQLEDINILAALVEPVAGNIPWTLHSLTDNEAVFKSDGDGYKAMVGISRANKDTLFIQYVKYAKDIDESEASMYEDMINQTFSQRVFVTIDSETGETIESSVQNPNEGLSQMYLPVGKSGYDIFLRGSSLAVPTSKGYDIWTNRGVVVSVESFMTGHTDLNLTEYNTNLVDMQKALIPSNNELEFFKVTAAPSSFMDVDRGFSCKIPFTYDKSEKHIEVYMMIVPEGFYTFTVHSNKKIPDKFLQDDFKLVLDSDRKTNGELADAPLAATVPTVEEDYIRPIHLNDKAISALASPSKDYLLETFGEARMSGQFLNKQLYFKDNFVHVLLPVSSEMTADQGIAEEAFSSIAPFGETELPFAEDINLKYSMFTTSGKAYFKGPNPLVPEELIGTLIGTAYDQIVKDYFAEMMDNNIIFQNESHLNTDDVYQTEFVYRYDDDVTNLKWKRNGAIFIKCLGSDRYSSDRDPIWFAAILDWGDNVDKSKLSIYQQAFESTVKQVPVHDGK